MAPSPVVPVPIAPSLPAAWGAPPLAPVAPRFVAADIPPDPAPVADHERIGELDFLRGFALLGVMLMNIPHISGWVYRGESSWLAYVLDALAQGKFISIFSMLFGYGLAMQLGRPNGSVGTYLRRNAALLVIGLAHAVLFFSGDILVSYAIAAFVALLFRSLAAKTLMCWAAALWVLSLVMMLLNARHIAHEGISQEQMAEYMEFVRTYAQGSYGDVVATRWAETRMQIANLLDFMPQLLATFFVGMAAARVRLFSDGETQDRMLERARRVALPTGLIASFVFAGVMHYGSGNGPAYAGSLLLWAAPVLAIGYSALLANVLRRSQGGPMMRGISAVGRMGLTNYLLHSVVFGLTFYGYAGGQFMQVGYASIVIIALVTYAAMIILSTWWLARYRFGPAEWLLRCATYGAAQPLRRRM